VFAACHHCARLLCQKHVSEMLDDKGKPLSTEFTKLGIESPLAHHCKSCLHVVKGRLLRFVLGGAGLAVLGLALLAAGTALGLTTFLLGSAVAGAAYVLDRKRVAESHRAMPRLPLLPNVGSVTISETMRGTLTLDAHGTYQPSMSPVEGELVLAMTLGRMDLDRHGEYCAKYRRPLTEPVDYCAGFAVLLGETGIKFDDPALTGIVVPLHGSTNDLPFFAAADGRTGAKWDVKSAYQLNSAHEVEQVPVWLTPSLVPESDQRSLEIEIQWTDLGPEDARLTILKIEPLTLHVPVSWGHVERASHSPTVGSMPDPVDSSRTVRRIEWNQIALNKQERDTRKLTLSILFEERISMDDVIRGRTAALFEGTLSGLAGVEVLLPLGGRKEPGSSRGKARTKVDVAFELSLAGIRYQEVRTVPDRDKDPEIPETEDFPGVIPDHETVVALTNALSDEQYYVKRVIENPARTSGKAHVVNRYWDIAGRWYDGVYPIDFSLSLTGEELHNGDIRAQAGNTKVRLSVHASYANAVMERQIKQEWKRLHGIVATTLNAARTEAPTDNGFGTQNGNNGPHGAPHDRTDLVKQRDDLITALVEGRISEQIFRDEVGRIDRRLGGQ
jgi:hypothetical protein